MESPSTTGSNRLADRAWLRAMDAYAAGAYARAEEEFRAAVQLDPGMADGWLGLHALRCDTAGALLAMYRHQNRFGEQRARHRRPLSSWYWLGWWVQPVLEDSRDLTLAHASHWLDGRHLTELDRALAECPPADQDPSVRFLHACRSYLLKDWEQLIRDTDRLLDDPLLGIEAGLFGGMARVRLDMCAQAQRPLAASLARCRSEQPQRKELRYWLARAYEGAGRSAAALPLYRAVHRADPAFMDTAARLAAISTEDGVMDGLLLAEDPDDDGSVPELLLPGADFDPDRNGEDDDRDSGSDFDVQDDQGYEPGYQQGFEQEYGQGYDPGYDPGGAGDRRTGYQSYYPAEERTEPLDSPAPRAAAERSGATAGQPAAGLPVPGARAGGEPAPLTAVPAGLDRVRGRKGLEAALSELEQMVGLDPVKRQVRALSAQLRMSRLRADQGLPVQPPKRHFVFSGPSGTGKTTVARILGQVFHALGLLSGDHLVEAQRADLVGEFLGQTAVKANELIDSALDGVLFIDEAYSLSNSGYSKGDAYGDEALQVLLKRAEDNRDRLVVILAGYPEGMNRLLATNPGLNSRFTTRVDFPSYRPAELTAIGRTLASGGGDGWDEDAADELASICAHVVGEGWIDELGNARFIRTLYEKSCAYRDLRLSTLRQLPTREDLSTLRLPDLVQAYGELIDGRA
ncbi:AAA family ATPase [Kitasatospora sp. MAP5-34]|uniref:AAA family ATPase n=1 Tax=Kitasatospora sp. MAP5-34 TaxID=3035102 RepID=UPI0024739D41|nr:AAA family ATPase [Kitasatospora sp. MAP5-34]MDH6577723.1 tetratricopeptide (TPR) repeat protein [Kitasatospora sp. MAP5-34]